MGLTEFPADPANAPMLELQGIWGLMLATVLIPLLALIDIFLYNKRILQARLNPPSEKKAEKTMPWGVFREGDKVMQIRNDYQLEWVVRDSYPQIRGLGVFNGDCGIIRFISAFDEICLPSALTEAAGMVNVPFLTAQRIYV